MDRNTEKKSGEERKENKRERTRPTFVGVAVDERREQSLQFQRTECAAHAMKQHLEALVTAKGKQPVPNKRGKVRRSLANQILEHRLLDRIKQYAWGLIV